MPDYILLMHNDAMTGDEWGAYIEKLQAGGYFRGGSAIGDGACARKSGPAPTITSHLAGYIRIEADSLDQAKSLLAGNPVFEAGGTVEVRELPRSR